MHQVPYLDETCLSAQACQLAHAFQLQGATAVDEGPAGGFAYGPDAYRAAQSIIGAGLAVMLRHGYQVHAPSFRCQMRGRFKTAQEERSKKPRGSAHAAPSAVSSSNKA